MNYKDKIAIIDWKAETMNEGSPENIRISDKIIIEQLDKIGFKNIKTQEILPLHFFIAGKK